MKGTQTIRTETRNIPGEVLTLKKDGEEFVGNGVTNVNHLRLRRSQLTPKQGSGVVKASLVGRLMTLSTY